MSTYSMTVAGLQRELPICKVTDDLYIGAFICFGDAELTEACGRELLKLGNKLLRSRPHAFIPCWRVTPSTTSPAAR